MQMTKGLSIKAALAIFSAIVAVIFIIVGVVAYSSAGSFRGIVEKSTRNAVLQQHTGDLGKMHDSIRGNIVTYILAFERGENDWLDRTEKKYAADKKLLLAALAAADANSTQATPEVRAAIAANRSAGIASNRRWSPIRKVAGGHVAGSKSTTGVRPMRCHPPGDATG